MPSCLLPYTIVTFIYLILRPEGVSLSDIIIKKELHVPLKFKKGNEVSKLNSLRISELQEKKLKIWPRGVIPYFIDDYSFDKVLRDRIRLFLEETSAKTGLQFLELPNPPTDDDTRWVFFVNRRGLLQCADCTTANFTDRGVQKIVLGYDCLGTEGGGALAATVLALAGVPPQHNSPDRDKYIRIIEDNIMPEKKQFFSIVPSEDWIFNNIPYDFASAGHYDFYKYTKNGQGTIRTVDKVDFAVGETKELSQSDILKIKTLYAEATKKIKPSMSEDCSRIFRPGKKFDEENNRQKMSLSSNIVNESNKDNNFETVLNDTENKGKPEKENITEKQSVNTKDEEVPEGKSNTTDDVNKTDEDSNFLQSNTKRKRGLKEDLEAGVDFDTDLDRKEN